MEAGCVLLEIAPHVLSSFQYIQSADDQRTPYMRYSNPTPYDRNSFSEQVWNPITEYEEGFTSPWTYSIDRQVALVELTNITQGRYICANNGTCTAPNTCACARGWMGFDCRVPICEQGFYEKNQEKFVRGSNDEKELEVFEKFLKQNKSYRLNPAGDGYSNPFYDIVVERFVNTSFVLRSNITKGGVRYLHKQSGGQGGYECSIRAVTEWEDYRSGRNFDHPNYFSQYMDRHVGENFTSYTQWNDMGWDPMYSKSSPLELQYSFQNNSDRVYIYTDEGYRRKGIWMRTLSNWTKGRCIVEFKRVCDEGINIYDLEAANHEVKDKDVVVQDTDLVRIVSLASTIPLLKSQI